MGRFRPIGSQHRDLTCPGRVGHDCIGSASDSYAASSGSDAILAGAMTGRLRSIGDRHRALTCPVPAHPCHVPAPLLSHPCPIPIPALLRSLSPKSLRTMSVSCPFVSVWCPFVSVCVRVCPFGVRLGPFMSVWCPFVSVWCPFVSVFASPLGPNP